jgi:alcohol dehydrogenase
VACGATLAAATRINVAALEERAPESAALPKYAAAARILSDASAPLADDRAALAALVRLLEDWRIRLAVPRLSAYGAAETGVPAIVADSRGGSMRTNPVVLTDAEIASILRASL